MTTWQWARVRPRCRASAPGRPRGAALALTLAVACAAGPGLSGPVLEPAPPGAGPAAQSTAAVTCWRPGEAPGLFSWSASPGIACRNGAGAGAAADFAPRPASGPAVAVPASPRSAPKAGRPLEVTFSGNAYVGVGVAF